MRKEKYPTDLTDSQWAIIEPLFSGMRNRKWSKRELVNAVLYLEYVFTNKIESGIMKIL